MNNQNSSAWTPTVTAGRGSGIKDFLNSNSIVARVSFLLLLILIFIIVLKFSIAFLTRILTFMNNSPTLINGMIDAKQLVVIPQNPLSNGSVTINRSINGPNGIEFTWSVWIFINDITYLSGQYKHIFSKGNNVSTTSTANNKGLNFPNNAPGMYIYPNTNDLLIVMNTYETINQEITINDIPIGKWVNVILRCRNKTLDVYINGTITKSVNLNGVPKQNYGDVFVAMNGGFDGYISDLRYYDYSLGLNDISGLTTMGPNLEMSSSNSASLLLRSPDYLSLRWYFYGSNGSN
jgi:Concanavalin A-like lectin/glucanases superfamily